MLHLRAELLRTIREFFRKRAYLEVETPLLSGDIVVDAHLHPFTVTTDSGVRYLQTSPEAAMKRLLAAGCGSIFQITRAFRRSENGERHNSEFTMIEWYGRDTTDHDQMDLTEQLVRLCFHQTAVLIGSSLTAERLHQPFRRLTYDDAMSSVLGKSILSLSADQLHSVAQAAGTPIPESLDTASRDDILNVILATQVEPKLGVGIPEFLYHYPASQAALARLCDHDNRLARRFELYCDGVELCNGYDELTDPGELKQRDQINNAARAAHDSPQLPGAPRMMAAMNHGLPACSGVALGFDRLVMVATGSTGIDQVIPFPTARA